MIGVMLAEWKDEKLKVILRMMTILNQGHEDEDSL